MLSNVILPDVEHFGDFIVVRHELLFLFIVLTCWQCIIHVVSCFYFDRGRGYVCRRICAMLCVQWDYFDAVAVPRRAKKDCCYCAQWPLSTPASRRGTHTNSCHVERKSSVAVSGSLFVFHLAYLQSSAFSLISSSGNLAWLFTLVTWSPRVWRHCTLPLSLSGLVHVNKTISYFVHPDIWPPRSDVIALKFSCSARPEAPDSPLSYCCVVLPNMVIRTV